MNGAVGAGAGGRGQSGVPRQACSGWGSVGGQWGSRWVSGRPFDLLHEDDNFGVIVEEEVCVCVWGSGSEGGTLPTATVPPSPSGPVVHLAKSRGYPEVTRHT